MLFRQAVRKKHLSQNQLTRSQQHSEVFQAPGAVAGVGRTLHCGRSRTGHPVGALGLGLRAFGRHEGTTVPTERNGIWAEVALCVWRLAWFLFGRTQTHVGPDFWTGRGLGTGRTRQGSVDWKEPTRGCFWFGPRRCCVKLKGICKAPQKETGRCCVRPSKLIWKILQSRS